MKFLWNFLRRYKKESVLGPLFKLFEAALELTVPLIIASVIDKGINGAAKSYIIWLCLLLVLLGAVGLGFSVIAQFFAAKASVGISAGIRGSLFSHLQGFSYSDVDRIGTSTMITRMTADTSKVQTGLNLALRLLLRSPFVVFGAMIMAFTIDTRSALTFVCVIPVLAIIVYGIMLITVPLYNKVQGGVDKVLLKTRENLSGARVIRAFGKENDEYSDFAEVNDSLTRVQKRVGYFSSLLNPLTYVAINIAIIALIYVGAIQVDSGRLSQGEVVALYNYMSQILIELIKFANLIVSIAKALASANRISAVLNTAPTDTAGNAENIGSSDTAVEFKGVSLKYSGASEEALRDISFSIGVGETVGIIGGTGSGKSSLINMIPGFYRATEGEVTLGGCDVASYTEGAVNKYVGIVPQRATLFKGTIRENMLVGKADATDEEIFEALRVAQADSVVADKGGLDAEVEQDGKNLSGGQRQRLTIARALVKKPRILILDDSASALDFATDAALRRAIKESTEGVTVFIVSQRTSSIMHADKIIVLDDGEIVGIGKHDELLSECPVYREIYDSQFKKEGA